MTETEKLTDAQLEALVRRHRELTAEVAEIQAETVMIKQRIDSNVSVGWKLTVDGVTASKREGNRDFDQVLAFHELDETEREECKVTRLDPKLVREMVEKKGRLEACMVRKPNVGAVTKL